MRVLIFGLGLNQGGAGSAKFFAQKGDEVKITDLKSEDILKLSIDKLKDFPNITYTLGEHKNEDIDWADLIIKNPAIKPGNQYIEYALKHGKQVEMDMGIFLQFVKPSQIIGVTGTKGKSTTASLIYEVFKKRGGANLNHLEGGLDSHVLFAGNIGKSVLDTVPFIVPDTLVILEISSFQLESFEAHKVSPKWAVVTNIYPDHLNYYKNMDEYIAGKKVVGKYQNPDDFLFINRDNHIISDPKFLEGFKGQIIFYSTDNLPAGFNPQLLGEHNKSNMAAALQIAKTFEIEEKEALETMRNFKGVEFRQQLVKSWNGVKIINDTTATGPDPAIQAIKTYPYSILICGGMNKGMDYKEFAKVVDKDVKKVFFLEGDSTEEIKRLMQNKEKMQGTYGDLEKLLSDVKNIIQPKDTVLFSPAATSFNLFQNEFDRGRKFNQTVQKVFADD